VKNTLNDFDGHSPKEFVKKFVNTNYSYQKEVFELMGPEYNLESDGDRERPFFKKIRTRIECNLLQN